MSFTNTIRKLIRFTNTTIGLLNIHIQNTARIIYQYYFHEYLLYYKHIDYEINKYHKANHQDIFNFDKVIRNTIRNKWVLFHWTVILTRCSWWERQINGCRCPSSESWPLPLYRTLILYSQWLGFGERRSEFPTSSTELFRLLLAHSN